MISVRTPSFNYGRFIQDTIRSVEYQDHTVIEHIVEDNLSGDTTLGALASHPNVKWRSRADSGQSDALNEAFNRSSGTWIALLNADEFYLPQGLGALQERGEAAGADVVFGDMVLVDRDGRLLRLVPQHRHKSFVLRRYGISMATCATLFRRDALGEAPWDTQLRRIMDWDLVLRLAIEGRSFLHVPFPVGAFRVHDQRVTAAPASCHADEYETVARRYELPRSNHRRTGRVAHAALKVWDGAYARQLRASSFTGSDFRWFASTEACANVESMRRACYGS